MPGRIACHPKEVATYIIYHALHRFLSNWQLFKMLIPLTQWGFLFIGQTSWRTVESYHCPLCSVSFHCNCEIHLLSPGMWDVVFKRYHLRFKQLFCICPALDSFLQCPLSVVPNVLCRKETNVCPNFHTPWQWTMSVCWVFQCWMLMIC